MPLPPLRFAPLFKPARWGGRRLPAFLRQPGVSGDAIGEAWVLSDVPGSESVVAAGPHAGRTLRDIAAAHPADLFGDAAPPDGRFPLLLKFLDARDNLSVQVHPDDVQAKELHGEQFWGKTEAWVILDADPDSVLYAGVRPGVTAEGFAAALAAGTLPALLHTHLPTPGDCLFLDAGTVHAIGAGVFLFEVQQTSDLTYRLYDWGWTDPHTGRPRELHVSHGTRCSRLDRGACHPVRPERVGGRERLVHSPFFTLCRTTASEPARVGEPGRPTAVVCVGGAGTVAGEVMEAGDVLLLPACVGETDAVPAGEWTLLECGPGA